MRSQGPNRPPPATIGAIFGLEPRGATNARSDVAFIGQLDVALENDCDAGAPLSTVSALMRAEVPADPTGPPSVRTVMHAMQEVVVRNPQRLPPEAPGGSPYRFETFFTTAQIPYELNEVGQVAFRALFREQDRCGLAEGTDRYEGLFRWVPDGAEAGLWLVAVRHTGGAVADWDADVYTLEIGGVPVDHHATSIKSFALASYDGRVAYSAGLLSESFVGREAIFLPEPAAGVSLCAGGLALAALAGRRTPRRRERDDGSDFLARRRGGAKS